MVLGWNEEEKRTEYLRLPKTKHAKAIRIFLYDGHYSTIKKMSALTRRDFGDSANHFCNFCPFHHRKEEAVKDHMKDCIADELTAVVMPEEGECVEFKNWEYTLRKHRMKNQICTCIRTRCQNANTVNATHLL